MPVMMGRGIPAVWTAKSSRRPIRSAGNFGRREECVRIALINNMPDAALDDTASQFVELLDSAAGDIPVHIEFYSLPEIVRSDRVQQHMNSFYCDVRDLPNRQFDAVIITGTEPHEPDLRDEPYWRTLVDVFDWAERNTMSTILSCLAAHASVFHSDGIERHLLSEKRFGAFEEKKVSDHPLMGGISNRIRTPHSRWNELREDELVSCGYALLTKSQESGVGLFVKQKRKSLFVHLQGHPEYDAQTLLKEYRRDIKRFFRRERETYPTMPCGYFNAPASKLLTDFQEQALSRPHENCLTFFPDVVIAETLQNTWHSAGARIYRNWLQYVVSRKATTPAFVAMARVARV